MSLPAAHTGGICRSFVYELMTKQHDLSSDMLRCALYAYDNYANPTNVFDADISAYTTANEVSGTGYTIGGAVIGGATVVSLESGGYALRLNDITWATTTITADQALIYNATLGNNAVAYLRFGSTQTANNATFAIRWPTGAPPLIHFNL